MVSQRRNAAPSSGGVNGNYGLWQNKQHNLNTLDSSVQSPHKDSTPIAVVGLASRFSGDTTSPSRLWLDHYAQHLDEFRDPSPSPPSDASGVNSGCYPDDEEESGCSPKSSRSSDFSTQEETLVHSSFLGIASDVLNELDVEARRLLQTVYEATEDAGIPIKSLAGSDTSVFVGFHGKNASCTSNLGLGDARRNIKNGMSLSSSISYLYDLRGASMSIDTGCSSSLVSLHQAYETIRSGQSQLSIVGAVDSHSACTLVLKSLDAAVNDGDHVHCVIKASSVSHNGRGLDTKSFVATEAASELFGKGSTSAGDHLSVGSHADEIIHVDGPHHGLAAIIKVALSMKGGQTVDGDSLLPISINSSGCGGTNGQTTLEAAPSSPTQVNGSAEDDEALSSRVFILSAEDANVTRTMAKNLAGHLSNTVQKGRSISLSDLAYTLSERRSRLSYIAAIRAESVDQLIAALDRPEQLKIHTNLKKPRRLGFVFNGQGAQWHAMGRELLTTYPVFVSAIKEADAVLRGFGADWSLEEELMRDAESTRVSEINISQPSTVALQLALVNLLQSWNIYPSAVVSHSTGEFAAAYAAGFLAFSQALGIAYHLGDLARKHYGGSKAGTGGMAAAAIGANDVEKYLGDTLAGGRVVVACVNSPKSVTLSGDSADLDEVLKRLDDDGIFARKLKVPLAYHSHQMMAFEAEFIERLQQLWPSEYEKQTSSGQDVVYASPVTGAVVDTPHQLLTLEYYVRNITSPVLFSDAFNAFSHHIDDVVEIGPHSTLSGPIREALRDSGAEQELGYMTCLKRPADAVQTMQDLVCDLLALGYPLSLRNVNEPTPKAQPLRFVPDLPTYPWNGHLAQAHTTDTGEQSSSPEKHEEVMTRSKITWELDILHNIPEEFKNSLRMYLSQDELDREKTLARASYYFIADAVLELSRKDQNSLAELDKEMMQWMVDTLERGERGDLGPGSALWSRATPGMKQLLYDELEQEKYGALGQLMARVGTKLPDLVRSKITIADLVRENRDLINKYYTGEQSLKSRAYKHLFQVAELFALKNPGARVLEIGGSSAGGATRAVLEAFGTRGTNGGTILGQYTFTATDAAHLKDARLHLASWDLDGESMINFCTLDLSQDLLEQSFSAESYDLIVVSMALTASSHNPRKTFLQVRKMLKPGGKLFMVQKTQGKLSDELLSRTLADRTLALSIQECDKILKGTGFTGVDFEIPDCEQAQYHGSNFIMSTAASTASVFPFTVSVLYAPPLPESWHEQLVGAIQDKLPGLNRVEAQNWDSFELPSEDQARDKIYVFTGDLVGPGSFVERTDEASFGKLERLLLMSAKLLWLSQGGVIDAKDTSFADSRDFLRGFKQPEDGKKIIRLDFEQKVDGGAWTSDKIGHIVHVIGTTLEESLCSHDIDCEYAVKDGMLHVPRIVPILDDEARKTNVEDTDAELSQSEKLPANPDGTVLMAVNGTLAAEEIVREVALSIVALGAANLIILGKDIKGHLNAESFVHKHEAGDECKVEVLDCDASFEDSLVGLLKNRDSSNQQPIRGVVVVEGRMRFDVALEEERGRPPSLGEWRQAVEAKASCLKTLDIHLSPSLSFLILSLPGGPLDKLSSFSLAAAGGAFQSHVLAGRAISTIHLDFGGVNETGRASILTTVIKDAIGRPPTTASNARHEIIVGLPQWNKIPPEAPMRRDRRFGTLRLGVPRRRRAAILASETSTASPAELLVQGLEAGGDNEQTVVSALQAQLAILLRVLSIGEIDPAKPLATYGVDSIVAIEVRTWLANSTEGKVKLSVLEILNAGSLYDVAKMVKARAG